MVGLKDELNQMKVEYKDLVDAYTIIISNLRENVEKKKELRIKMAEQKAKIKEQVL